MVKIAVGIAAAHSPQNVSVLGTVHAVDTSLLDQLPLAGEILPHLSPRLKACLFQVFDVSIL